MTTIAPIKKHATSRGCEGSLSSKKPSPTLLRRLGIVGMDPIEPVILAALAMESPLLLIGPHGTAKSLLLNRLSIALGLTWRHYNTSLLNYDDLVGYPLPDEHGKLKFVETPASIWEAGVVFLDEISRARPDMQNRLFSIIHEKRIQGMKLEKLRHRWAAMNPPATDHEEEHVDVYEGSEPLDPALADRFNFIIEVPRLQSLSEQDRASIIRSSAQPITDDDCEALRHRLTQIREQVIIIEEVLGDAVSEYIRVIMDYTQQMGLQLSGRRATMLYRNIIAVHTACTLDYPQDPCDSAWLALYNALPQRAQGIKIETGKLLIAHNESWKTASLDKYDARRLLSADPDPVRRAIRACTLPKLSAEEVSAYVADGLAEATPGGRHALATYVIDSPVSGRLNAAIAEQVADLYAATIVAQDLHESIGTGSPRHRTWLSIVEALAELPGSHSDTTIATNLLAGLFAMVAFYLALLYLTCGRRPTLILL